MGSSTFNVVSYHFNNEVTAGIKDQKGKPYFFLVNNIGNPTLHCQQLPNSMFNTLEGGLLPVICLCTAYVTAPEVNISINSNQ
jgi:hypothetical protein